MARRRKQNQAGTVYLVLVGIGIFLIFLIYLGAVKDPIAKMERRIEKISLNLEQRL